MTIPERARDLCRQLEAMPSEGNIRLIEEALRWQARLDAEIADEHLARIPGHDPDRRVRNDDAEAAHKQGYGNAALNIGVAIRTGAGLERPE